MHCRDGKLRSATCWLAKHLGVFALALFFSAVCQHSLFAAGCSHSSDGTTISLDAFGNPLASNVVKVYSGGEFKYYALPTGSNCKGPNCRSAPAPKMSALPPATPNDRTDLTFLASVMPVGRSLYCDRYSVSPTAMPVSVFLDGLLRPPTV